MKVLQFRPFFILLFSALIITLSLGINDLFHDIKDKYISDTFPKIVADIIYICVIIGTIIIVYFIARLFKIDLQQSIK